MHPASKDLTDISNNFGSADSEVNAKEVGIIRALRSNGPEIGYIQWPKHSGESDSAK